MAIKDILLALRTYPEPTQPSTIEHAVSTAAALHSHIAATTCEIHLEIPPSLDDDYPPDCLLAGIRQSRSFSPGAHTAL